ncbi:MAG: hypothetical protein VCA55_10325 [Verrucomicrobiales bacterium]
MMALDFEELDYAQTRMGELILRRRRMPSLDNLEVYEVILGDAFLMSSLFTVVETALADLGLAALGPRQKLDVVVGGLGLGYTAKAVLNNADVQQLMVIDALEEVIGWHQSKIIPLGKTLCDDPRCRFVHGDFFAMAASPSTGFDHDQPGRRFDAVLLDIDHTPSKLLDASHADFYTVEGLQKLAGHLKPGGVFAMWSDDPPEETFIGLLGRVFKTAEPHVVSFFNPLQERDSTSTVYVACNPVAWPKNT